ncbi:MAG: phosphatidate cytidylyltransferase [Deltaproteobacteria bacterium]|nr:phosphatidate cytidylyltransferase [Deltaproteobacteria bacterium]
MLKTRAVAALIFAPLVLGLVIWGATPLALATVVLALLMARELTRLVQAAAPPADRVLTYLGTFAVAWQTAGLPPQGPTGPLVAVGVLLLFVAVLLRPDPIDQSVGRAAAILFAAVYCGALIPYLSRLREVEDGAALAVIALCCTWGADTGAYFAGRAFGRHKLYPKVSPGKTWEGLSGGLVASVGLAFLIRWLFRTELAAPATLILGLIAALCGVAGDLFESLLKRSVGAKDSGTLLPGHGGVLDRFDALMFVAPAVYIYVELVVRS